MYICCLEKKKKIDYYIAQVPFNLFRKVPKYYQITIYKERNSLNF